MEAAMQAVEAIGVLSGQPPERLVQASDGGTIGAVWIHPPAQAVVPGLAQHAVALHLGGCTLVEKWTDGRLAGHRSRIGSVSLVPADRKTAWVISGTARVAHLYVDPHRLRALAAEHGEVTLRDFFSEDDPVLAALMRVALAMADTHACGIDLIERDQLDVLVARHLLTRYLETSPAIAWAARPVAFTGPALRRLFDYVEGNLHRELRLAELASQVHLSEDHFLRSFKATVGQTPHQYLIGCRLTRARQLLREGCLPLAEIGRRCGFRSASHFAATFRRCEGVAPSQWARRTRMR
jgi:AraC family transcriptional regulator